MAIYQRSNKPTSVVKALTGRIEDVIHGYDTADAKAALAAVSTFVEEQTPAAEVAPAASPAEAVYAGITASIGKP